MRAAPILRSLRFDGGLSRPLLRTRAITGTLRFASSESSSRASLELPNKPSTRFLSPIHTFLSPSSSSFPANVKEVIHRGDQYLLPVYARPPLVLSHGKGLHVWDTEGREYLDFSAGIAVNALGHGDEAMNKVLVDQASKLLHTSNVYHNEWAGKLAELLITLTQTEGGLGWATGASPPEGSGGAKVFFANSGTEANEGALKIARKVGKDRWAAASGRAWDDAACDKTEIVCFANAFHGRSLGALSATPNPKYQKPFGPLIPGVRVGTLNDYDQLRDGLVNAKTCAVIVEPVQGEGGCAASEVAWLSALRRACDDVGAVLIYDEVQCGLYRSGTMWAHSAMPVEAHPDIVTMAKPLANGYPIGAVLLRDRVAATMTAGTHGTTFGGSPMACALGHHVLSRISARPFVAHIAETALHLRSRLERLPAWFPHMLRPDIRGRGLILGLSFKNAETPGKIVGLARERGVLLLTAGSDAVRFVPSLTVTKEEVDHAIDVLEGCLAKVSEQ